MARARSRECLFASNQRKRHRQNESSYVARNSSSNNSSNDIDLVSVTRRFGKPNETARDVKRGSTTDLESIGPAMIVVLTREPRNSRS
jgi:hypothetical protein